MLQDAKISTNDIYGDGSAMARKDALLVGNMEDAKVQTGEELYDICDDDDGFSNDHDCDSNVDATMMILI